MNEAHQSQTQGNLPEGWRVLPLHRLCREPITYGIVQCGPHIVGGIPYIRVSDMNEPELDVTSMLCTSTEIAGRFTRSTVEEGDLVYALRGKLGEVRKVGPAVAGANLTQGTARLAPRAEISTEYLMWAMRSPSVMRQAELVAKGSTFVELTLSSLRLLEIPLPPNEQEQRAIATALSGVDALIAGLERLIAKKRDIKQATMQQLLTGQTRLPGFSGEWRDCSLGQIAHIKTGSRNNEDKIEDGAYPFFVRSANVERINTYSHDCEAILVPGEGQIGSIFHYVNGRFDVHQRVYAITQFADGISGRFVHLFMSQHFGAWAMQNTVKATVDSLRLPTFQTFEMCVPPTLEEQTAIATVLSDMDADIEALEARLAKTCAIKQGMMQELLKGRTRLVDLEAISA
jgi:type I restriction enzyme S subunit